MAKPLIADGLVFAGATTGVLHALDMSTGRPVGIFGEGSGIISNAAFSDGTLYFASGNIVYAMR